MMKMILRTYRDWSYLKRFNGKNLIEHPSSNILEKFIL